MPKLTADQRADQAKVRDAANANRDAVAAADKPVGEQIAEQRQADTKTETGTRAPTDADFTAQVEAAAARAEAEEHTDTSDDMPPHSESAAKGRVDKGDKAAHAKSGEDNPDEGESAGHTPSEGESSMLFGELVGQGDVTRQFLEDALNEIHAAEQTGLVAVQLRCAIRILDAEVVSVGAGGACFRSGTNGQTYWVTYNSIDAIIV